MDKWMFLSNPKVTLAKYNQVNINTKYRQLQEEAQRKSKKSYKEENKIAKKLKKKEV